MPERPRARAPPGNEKGFLAKSRDGRRASGFEGVLDLPFSSLAPAFSLPAGLQPTFVDEVRGEVTQSDEETMLCGCLCLAVLSAMLFPVF